MQAQHMAYIQLNASSQMCPKICKFPFAISALISFQTIQEIAATVKNYV